MKLPVDYTKISQPERRKVRLAYIELQKNRCAFCQEPLDGKPSQDVLNKPISSKMFPVGFLLHPIHLHHNHKTGMTIGAVHARCNAVSFQYHGE